MRHVRIVPERVEAFAGRLATLSGSIDSGEHDLGMRGTREDCANYVLIADALNFCFWSELPWEVEYRGKSWTRTFAMMAGLLRGIEKDHAWLTAPRWMAATGADVGQLFAGTGSIPFPERRVEIFHETGVVLAARYRGTFARLVDDVDGDARRVAYRLAEEFPSFRDVVEYDGREIAFLKRAQICAADLHRTWLANGHPGLANMEALTVFADYRLPQLLRHEGLLVLDDAFAQRVDDGKEIPAGSAEEVELRAATVWLSKLIADALARTPAIMLMWELDYILWVLARRPDVSVPHHRTVTHYY
jgi:hypothetical protein